MLRSMNYEETAAEDTGEPGDPPALSATIGVLWPLVIFSNAFVVLSISRKSSLQSVVNYFVMNLAAGNSMIGIILMPMMITESVHPRLVSTGFLCNIMIAASFIVCLMTILTIITLTIAHVILIENPRQYGKYLSTCRLMTGVCVMWVVSIVFSSLCITVMKEHDATRCRYHLIVDVSTLHLVVLGVIVLPTMLCLLINAWLLFRVKRGRSVGNYQESDVSGHSHRGRCDDFHGNRGGQVFSVFDSRRRGDRRDSVVSSAHSHHHLPPPAVTYYMITPTVVIIIVELICWTPLTISATLQISTLKIYTLDIIDWTGCLSLICSMLIPCIHALQSRTFRTEVWALFTRNPPVATEVDEVADQVYELENCSQTSSVVQLRDAGSQRVRP